MRKRIRTEAVEKARRTRWINLGLVAGILIVLNVLGTNAFLRVDLTGRKIYSISSASKEVVRNLEDRLTIKAYFSDDLPAQYGSLSRYLKDKLDDYRAFSRGMVNFEFVDPGSDEELEQEALSYGIQPAMVRSLERDKLEVKQVFMALVFLYEGRSETIPLVESTAGIEYDITTAIRRVSSTELPVVGFLSGHGMATPTENMNQWTQQLERHYRITTVSVDSFRFVPPDVEALFLVGPKSGFSEWERYAIDQFILRGGRTVWLMEMTDADLQNSQQGMAAALQLNMEPWLAHYGVQPRPALVMDRANNQITIAQRQGLFQVRSVVPYPFFPIAQNFNPEHPMVKDLDQVPFFYMSPIDTALAVPDSLRPASGDTIHSWPSTPPRLAVEPLAYSSEVSGTQENFFFIQPNPAMAQGQFSGGPYVLAASVTGSFRSAFASFPAVPDTVTLPATISGPVDNRLVVVGDATFATNDYLSEGGVRFLLNIVDWLFQDEALIGIRAKEVDYRPLKEVGNAARAIVKWLNILVPPALAIIAGLFWWRYRRRRNRGMLGAYEQQED
jgi:ABC-type uncharacterized transport system involved in gliding motility auxiliary subunit